MNPPMVKDVSSPSSHNTSNTVTMVYSMASLLVVRPAWALTGRWKSSGDLVTGTQGNRKVTLARAALKEAGNEPTGRRTEIG